MIVDYSEYWEAKLSFLKKHKSDFTIHTSPMDEYGMYTKQYVCADGAIWYESMCPEYIDHVIEIRKAKVRVEVKMLRTEFWSSDDASSKYYYEQF